MIRVSSSPYLLQTLVTMSARFGSGNKFRLDRAVRVNHISFPLLFNLNVR
jgi:hypothetical protein